MWTNSLYRLKWLGMGCFWEGQPERSAVREYTRRAFGRPSFRRDVIQWPMAYSSLPHVKEFRVPITQLKFFWHLSRRRTL